MKKIALTLLSSALFMSAAHADADIKNLQAKTFNFFQAAMITDVKSQEFLKNSFSVDNDTFRKNGSVIYSTYSPEEYYGMPFAFAFNEGKKIVGIGGALTDESEAFFKKIATSPNMQCKTKETRFNDIRICSHKTAKPETIRKFTTDLSYLMENAG